MSLQKSQAYYYAQQGHHLENCHIAHENDDNDGGGDGDGDNDVHDDDDDSEDNNDAFQVGGSLLLLVIVVSLGLVSRYRRKFLEGKASNVMTLKMFIKSES